MFRVPGADELLRGSLLHMSDSKALAHWLTHNPLGRGLASRFVAGETLESAIEAVGKLNVNGIRATLDHLGEAVTNPTEAIEAAGDYVRILERLEAVGAVDGGPGDWTSGAMACNVSLKLTQMGLDISRTLCMDNLLRILEKAQQMGQFVRVDMESSRHTEETLRVFEDVWQRGYTNCGIVLQAYLYRTEADVERAIELGCRVRLCKGAYAEPVSEAFDARHDIDKSFARCLRILMAGPGYPMIATHDPRLIAITRSLGMARPAGSFEYQMLYGVRPDEQRRLAASGAKVRVYVPYGGDWYPYLVRRLAERPANLALFLRSLGSKS